MMKFDGFDLLNFQVRANSEDLTAELVGGKKHKTWAVDQKPWLFVSGIFSLGGALKHFLCSPLFGEDPNLDSYFSDGLEPSTS